MRGPHHLLNPRAKHRQPQAIENKVKYPKVEKDRCNQSPVLIIINSTKTKVAQRCNRAKTHQHTAHRAQNDKQGHRRVTLSEDIPIGLLRHGARTVLYK